MSLAPASQEASPPALTVSAAPSADWDGFVSGFPGASVYMRSDWIKLARDVFRLRAWCVEARDSTGSLVGVLPLLRRFADDPVGIPSIGRPATHQARESQRDQAHHQGLEAAVMRHVKHRAHPGFVGVVRVHDRHRKRSLFAKTKLGPI